MTAARPRLSVRGRSIAAGDHAAWRQLRTEVGLVFQDYALFPNLSALKNITLAPLHRGEAAASESQGRYSPRFIRSISWAILSLAACGNCHCGSSAKSFSRSGITSRSRASWLV